MLAAFYLIGSMDSIVLGKSNEMYKKLGCFFGVILCLENKEALVLFLIVLI
jgi:hypothetical protein